MHLKHKPLVLVVLDGFGYRETSEHNAIALAKTPFFDRVMQQCPWTLIAGSGQAVGLPQNQMGNSEVGHLNIGAGRVVQQDFTRVEAAIQSGDFFKNPVLVNAVQKAVKNNHAVHIMGLLSPGGVHSHEEQIAAMIQLAAQQNATRVYLHAFLDGRDTPPRSALPSLQKIEALFKKLKCGRIASLIGRYYAMDRDQRWERVQAAYDLLTQGKAVRHATTSETGLQLAYEQGEDDEFVKATVIGDTHDAITVQDGDVIICMNYRADRVRQLTRAFTDEKFNAFPRAVIPALADYVTLTEYDATFKHVSIAYTPLFIKNTLGAIIAAQGLKQLRIAETEKYAHVTFFFNGGVEAPLPHEDRILIPSPKIATYDLQPEMSALTLTDQLIQALPKYDVIICNYANADMVGHSGDLLATIKAIETLDTCLARVEKALLAQGGEMLITADHGNAEKMFDEITQQPHTAHTNDPVPFIYIGRPAVITHQHGALYDVAPTMLYLMNIAKPPEMTGTSLLSLNRK